MEQVKSSILISIFKRKGDEGQYTKIVQGNTKLNNIIPLSLGIDEIGLLLYYKSEDEWFLLSNKKIRSNYRGKTLELDVEDLQAVNIAMQEEFSNGIRDKKHFNKLRITDKRNNSSILHLEKGLPYEGIYQVLHFLASKYSNLTDLD